MAVDTCFIYGSAPSILDLTEEERAALNAHPATLAMNKFLLFKEKAGLEPTAAFLADRQFPAQLVFKRMVEVGRRMPVRPQFYINEYYRRQFWREKERKKLLAHHSFEMQAFQHYADMSFFNSGLDSLRPFFWADDLSQELYFYRGSLTTALNLMNVLYPKRRICLLGVELDSPGSFYDQEIAQMPEFFTHANERVAKRMRMAREQQVHGTAITYNDVPGVQSVLPTIVETLRDRESDLVCCSPSSLLVKESICEYKPVLDMEAAKGEYYLAELATRFDVHPNQITQ